MQKKIDNSDRVMSHDFSPTPNKEDNTDRKGKHNYPGGDLSSAKCITYNCSDGEKTATDQITRGDDNLSNHPGVSDATAAA
ncbi:hypothetical protein Bca52824_024974 [Brassica carinata]|uniref:Uncharacterized protein n=1 Tax=Brassica carinata TaxID=52824 RepID=A0A8X8AW94_BRACI|nr:hypothetical protein Bca52824_024974 [Brassica carinata]